MKAWSARSTAFVAAWALLACILLPGCGGKDPASPDPDPGESPDDGPTLAVLRTVTADTLPLHSTAPGWTADSEWILFTAGPGSNVWKVHRRTAELLPVTDPEITTWVLGGYAPSSLGDGRIVFFQGIVPGDVGMHIMTADSAQIAGEPPAEILYTFSGTPVGLAPNQISSPTALSLDASGRRAVGTWNGTWFLTWSESDPPLLLARPATGLEEATSFRIGSTGEWVTYVDAGGTVHWMPFTAQETFPIAPGAFPSLAAADSLIGYVAPNGSDYVLVDREKGGSTAYAGRPDLAIRHAVLSPDGRWLAFLHEDEGVLGLYCGQFLN